MADLVLGAGGAAATAYTIDQSLRFNDGDSAYLSKTFGSAGDRNQWTFSYWFKRGTFPYSGNDPCVLNAGEGRIGIDRNDNLWVRDYDGSQKPNLKTTQVFRDPASWYHVVVAMDTPQAVAANRTKIYVNGSQVTAFGTETYPDQDQDTTINNNVEHLIGKNSGDNGAFDGYLAEVYFIDGQTLDADDFGETDEDTNQWKPIDASGLTFGTNGFYQKYGDPHGYTSFTTVESTTWTAPAGITSVDYLVVAGGGGGGGGTDAPYVGAGGGGAGGFKTGSLSVTPGSSYTVTVGAGGTTQSGTGGQGNDGSDSVFSSITSTGGGGGGGLGNSGRTGGSGGGGPGNGSGGAGTGSEGFAGGDGTTTNHGAGGGGGASEVGADGAAAQGGVGGDGLSNSLSGSATTYGGGGGGGSNTSSGSAGGSGGGGTGGYANPGTVHGTAGTANTGGGGGGGGYINGDGGAGGSGIVIIKVDTGFGTDSSGNDNTFAVTNLVASDKMVDSSTNNFPTFNPLCKITAATNNGVLSEGNLTSAGGAGTHAWPGTFAADSGKWYWEVLWTASTATGGRYMALFDAGNQDEWNAGPDIAWTDGRYGIVYDGNVGDIYNNGTSNMTQTGLTTLTDGDIISVALNLDASPATIQFYKNNATIGNAEDLNASASGIWGLAVNSNTNWTWYLNAGSDSSFSGNETAQGNQDGNSIGDFYYAPPSGYLALCTDNLPDPEIKLPGDNFNTIIYAGDDANPRTLTGVGFQPDLTWIKSRTGAYSHQLFDAVRGVGEALYSNNDEAEYSDSATGHLSAWTADGYTVSGSSNTEELNDTGQNYVAWNWLGDGVDGGTLNEVGDIDSYVNVNTASGFSILKFTGNKTASQTVGHGLSQQPTLGIIKNASASGQSWRAYFSSVGATNYGYLDRNDAFVSSAGTWSPTSSVFTVDDSDSINGTGNTILAYCFHSVEGYSKIGAYSGNGNVDGTFVYTGFRPAFVMYKATNQAEDWYMLDDKRDTYNVVDKSLIADSSAAEVATTASDTDFVSNGFKLRTTTSGNWSGYNWVYLAFAESPFKYANAR